MLHPVGTVTAAPPASPTRYEQTDPHLAYTGVWTNSSTASASGGNFKYANAAGGSVTVSLSGTYLAWTTRRPMRDIVPRPRWHPYWRVARRSSSVDGPLPG